MNPKRRRSSKSKVKRRRSSKSKVKRRSRKSKSQRKLGVWAYPISENSMRPALSNAQIQMAKNYQFQQYLKPTFLTNTNGLNELSNHITYFLDFYQKKYGADKLISPRTLDKLDSVKFQSTADYLTPTDALSFNQISASELKKLKKFANQPALKKNMIIISHPRKTDSTFSFEKYFGTKKLRISSLKTKVRNLFDDLRSRPEDAADSTVFKTLPLYHDF